MDSKKIPCDLRADPALFTRISRLIVNDAPIEEVLQTILNESVRICDAVRGFLAIADHDRGELDVRHTTGTGWDEEKRVGRLKVSEETGRGITSRAAATRRPHNAPNVFRDPYYIMSFDDVRSEIAVPLVDSFKRTRGVLNVESNEFDAFCAAHESTLTGLTDLATMALTLSEHRARESALVEVGRDLNDLSDDRAILQKVIDIAADALKFEDCSLFLIDKSSGELVLGASRGALSDKIGKASYKVGEGLTGWTVEQGRVIRLTNPASDPRWRGLFEEMPAQDVGAFMAVPIKGSGGVNGVIRVQRKKSPYKWFPNDFTEDDELMLSTIAAQLGIALDNARLVDQLVKTERMAAWGDMSARSAHMIGNRVFAIKGDVNELEYVLQQIPVHTAEAMTLLDSTKKGIFLLEEILNEFREFVTATHLELEEADLNELVAQSIDEGFPKRSTTELKLNISPELPPVKADVKKLKRCFTELMENSVNFLPDGGRITVSTSFANAGSKKWLRPGQQTANYLQVCFEDDGPGVDVENKPRIFNPFFTSRAKGMGLGLSIVKGIVDAHKGVIFEDGTPGKGARFTILIPFDKGNGNGKANGHKTTANGK